MAPGAFSDTEGEEYAPGSDEDEDEDEDKDKDKMGEKEKKKIEAAELAYVR